MVAFPSAASSLQQTLLLLLTVTGGRKLFASFLQGKQKEKPPVGNLHIELDKLYKPIKMVFSGKQDPPALFYCYILWGLAPDVWKGLNWATLALWVGGHDSDVRGLPVRHVAVILLSPTTAERSLYGGLCYPRWRMTSIINIIYSSAHEKLRRFTFSTGGFFSIVTSHGRNRVAVQSEGADADTIWLHSQKHTCLHKHAWANTHIHTHT